MLLPSRYELDSGVRISGGFGSVSPVHDTYLDRHVLFKSMHDPSSNNQLLNEIRGLSAAQSRHVVNIYDVILDEHDDVAGIIIERLTGREYSDFYLEAANNPLAYLRLIYQLACALRDLHFAGIVHRDIKLENMRESDSGILKIYDFGISCAGTGYHTKENRGTLVYAAPELFEPGVEITSQMDMYALGVCCWALATNQLPAVLFELPPQKSARAPSLDTIFLGAFPAEVVQLLDRCLHPNPGQRPQAGEAAELLEKHLVRGAHRGIFVQGSNTIYELSSAKPNVLITIAPLGELRVAYDGVTFRVTRVSGSVFINNVPVQPGMKIPDACVLTFGDFVLGAARQWVTFLSSNPEHVL